MLLRCKSIVVNGEGLRFLRNMSWRVCEWIQIIQVGPENAVPGKLAGFVN